MVVSVPEKTLEHWASLYLTYRYRSHASLWWPTRGEDVHVGYLSPLAGKSVQLELKTTTLSSKGTIHDVEVDLWQLDNYLSLPHHLRPFYVFPVPHWTDTLETAATMSGIAVAELGFSRVNTHASKAWWFAHWMAAMTTDQVAAILCKELVAHRAGGSSSAKLIRFDFRSGTRIRTWADGKHHRTVPWQSLWTKLNECGRRTWPQVVRLPAPMVRPGRTISHVQVRDLLIESREWNGELITLGSTEDGSFVPVDGPSARREDLPEPDGSLDHRIAVFLSAEALGID